MHLTYNTLYQTLSKQSYIQVPFPLGKEVLQRAIETFFAFLEQPAGIKNHIDFTIAPLHRRGDVGYKQRDAQDHVYNDSKEFFHFHPALLSLYEDFLAQNPVVAEFMLQAKGIWDRVHDTVYQLLQLCEGEFPGIVNKVFVAKHQHILLRFLKYDWQTSGKHLAKPHFDAGSCTLAIAESCAGLRIGSQPEDLQLIEHKENHAIFMLASNYKQLMNTEVLSPGWHDVIQLDETRIGKPFARWAIVAFIEADGVEALPRTETHKWYVPI